MKNEKRILVVNCGSSSIKLSVFEDYQTMLDVHIKGINANEEVQLEVSSSKEKQKKIIGKNLDIFESLKWVFEHLNKEYGITPSSIGGIGHRFVHGGAHHVSSARITPKMIKDLEKLSDLAPLHNDACLAGIKGCLKYFGKSIPEVVVFDTAFHSTIPEVAANYAIDKNISSKYQIKRYGFHGISNAFLMEAFEKYKGKLLSKIIILHLGNGCSMTAIQDGKSIDNSMGFTPAEGLIMGTRAGDIDSALVEFLCLHENKTPTEIMELFNSQSGLLGVSGLSSDMKTLLESYQENDRARLAVDMFCYRAVKYLGAYLAVLGGADAIIFSGGIGENASKVRELIIQRLQWMGIKLDQHANKKDVALKPGEVRKISTSDSTVELYVIATDENLFIAHEVVHSRL